MNGKDWTPYAFLVSKHGGLGLDVAKDQATLDALAGALPSLMGEQLDAIVRIATKAFEGYPSRQGAFFASVCSTLRR